MKLHFIKIFIVSVSMSFSTSLVAANGWEVIADNTQQIYNQLMPNSKYDAKDEKQSWTPFFNLPQILNIGSKVSTPDGVLEISHIGNYKEVLYKNVVGRYYSNIKFKRYEKFSLSGFVFRPKVGNLSNGLFLPLNIFNSSEQVTQTSSISETLKNLFLIPNAVATVSDDCNNNVNELYTQCIENAQRLGCKNGEFCIHALRCIQTFPGSDSGCAKQAEDSAKACNDYNDRETNPEYLQCMEDKKADCWNDAMNETLAELAAYLSSATAAQWNAVLTKLTRSIYNDARAFMDVKATDKECHDKATEKCEEDAKDRFDQKTTDIDKKFKEDLEKCCHCEFCHPATPQQTTIGN